MKNINKLFLIAIVLITVSCFGDTDLTSPFTERRNINRENDPTTVRIAHNQRVNINNDFTIHFNRVIADSRCPMDAICLWAGNGEVELNLSYGRSTERIVLNTYLNPKEHTFRNYKISLKELRPYPKSTSTIRPGEYVVVLEIRLLR